MVLYSIIQPYAWSYPGAVVNRRGALDQHRRSMASRYGTKRESVGDEWEIRHEDAWLEGIEVGAQWLARRDLRVSQKMKKEDVVTPRS